MRTTALILAFLALLAAPGRAGPYSAATGDETNPHDAPIPGALGPDGTGRAPIDDGLGTLLNPRNRVNPLFFQWASGVAAYAPGDGVVPEYQDSSYALGPVTGDEFDVVSLGERDADALAAGDPPGTITLTFDQAIGNGTGADFAIFENAFTSGGLVSAELAYVEVSDGGSQFFRFPSVALDSTPVGPYGFIDPTDLLGLAGKHANHFGRTWGTPFDLADVGLERATHVRIVDIPGSGGFTDTGGNPIHDQWPTEGTGGFDLEAVGVIATPMTFAAWPARDELPAGKRGEGDDPDGDGVTNLGEYAFALLPWQADGTPAATVRGIRDGDETYLEITFIRDERLADISYTVEAATSLAPANWQVIARSAPGLPLEAEPGHSPSIREEAGSAIASVGVLHRVILRDGQPVAPGTPRYLRVVPVRLP